MRDLCQTSGFNAWVKRGLKKMSDWVLGQHEMDTKWKSRTSIKHDSSQSSTMSDVEPAWIGRANANTDDIVGLDVADIRHRTQPNVEESPTSKASKSSARRSKMTPKCLVLLSSSRSLWLRQISSFPSLTIGSVESLLGSAFPWQKTWRCCVADVQV